MNILVVEDDPTSSKLVHIVLEEKGFRVVSAHDTEKALVAIKESTPEIILMDLSLPGMDGLELTRLLKRDPITKGIPIIAITSYPDRFPRERALRAGCDAYIVKPIDTRTLPAVVARIAAGTNDPEQPGRVR